MESGRLCMKISQIKSKLMPMVLIYSFASPYLLWEGKSLALRRAWGQARTMTAGVRPHRRSSRRARIARTCGLSAGTAYRGPGALDDQENGILRALSQGTGSEFQLRNHSSSDAWDPIRISSSLFFPYLAVDEDQIAAQVAIATVPVISFHCMIEEILGQERIRHE